MSKKTVELTKTFYAPASVVFDAIAGGYLLRATGTIEESLKHDFRVDGEYSLNWKSLPTASCSGRYIEIIKDKLVKFTWTSRNCPGATDGETIVTVMLAGKDDSCEMKLVHEGLTAGICYDDHLAGWTSSYEEFGPILEALTVKV